MMYPWRNDAPPRGEWCEVWFWTQCLRARFDGERWRTRAGGWWCAATAAGCCKRR